MIAVFLTAVTVAAFLVLSDRRGPASATATDRISGPYAELLDDSTDLGPAQGGHVQLTAALHGVHPPR